MNVSAEKVYKQLRIFMSMLHWMCFVVSSLYYIQIVGMTPLELVLTGTTLEASIFILEIPTGMVADVFGRRISILIGLLLNAAGFLLQGLWPAFVGVLLAQVLWGAGYTFTSGASEAWITDETSEEIAAVLFVKAEQKALIGAVVGLLIGMLFGLVNYAAAIVLSGIGFVFLTIYMISAIKETGYTPLHHMDSNPYVDLKRTLMDGMKLTRMNHQLLWIFAVGFIFGFYSEGVDRLWEAHMVADFQFPWFEPVIWFGLVQIAAMLMGSLGLAWIQKKKDIAGLPANLSIQIYLTIGIIISLFIFAVSGNFLLAIIMITFTQVFREVHMPFYTGWVNRKLDSSVRATVISMSSQVDAMGQIGGGPFVGSIANRMGIPSGLMVSAGLLTFALPIYAVLLRKLNGKKLLES
jgi:DHA3 family tetracycline resistance protein-like MFS transporter